MCALVAMFAWAHHWQGQRSIVRVRIDSISALVLVLKLKTSGAAAGIIARDIALDIASGVYEPHVTEHVPGIANVTCDVLSRKFDPRKSYELPRLLEGVSEQVLPLRDSNYFKSLTPPAYEKKKTAEQKW